MNSLKVCVFVVSFSVHVQFCTWRRTFATRVTFIIPSKEKVAESDSSLVKTCEHALSLQVCEVKLRKFNSGDFNVIGY